VKRAIQDEGTSEVGKHWGLTSLPTYKDISPVLCWCLLVLAL